MVQGLEIWGDFSKWAHVLLRLHFNSGLWVTACMATLRPLGQKLALFCGSPWLLKDNRAFVLDIGCVRGPQDRPQV